MADTVTNIATIVFIGSAIFTAVIAAKAAVQKERDMVLRPIPVEAKTQSRRLR